MAATQLQTLSIKVGKLIFILLAFSFAFTAYADVYKCVVNGKTVYSDSRCAYKPDTVKIEPNQNVIQGYRASVNNDDQPNSERAGGRAECARLLDKLNRVQTRGDLDKYSTIYELRCMAPGEREVSAQNRSREKHSANWMIFVTRKMLPRYKRMTGGSRVATIGSSQAGAPGGNPATGGRPLSAAQVTHAHVSSLPL